MSDSDKQNGFLATAVLCGALAATLILALVDLFAAPAPQPRPPRTADAKSLCGTWSAQWAASPGTMTFNAEGGYCHRINGATFYGSYAVAKGRLWVHEHREGEDVWKRWDAKLSPAGKAGWTGDVTGDYGVVAWELQPATTPARKSP